MIDRVTAGALALATAVLSSCGGETPAPDIARPVVTHRVGAAADPGIAVYSGEVRARHENDLAFRIGGKVVSRHVELGAAVRKGQLLARLDPADTQLAAQAARSQAAGAQADHALAQAEFDRASALFERRFISQALLDSRASALAAARARLDQALAQQSIAQNQSAYAALHAERDGIIIAVHAEPGQVIAAGQPAFRFAVPGEREVAISVPETRLSELRAARQLTVRLWAQPQRSYRARVREIAPLADTATRTFAARISILQADAAVSLGMSASVSLDRNGASDLVIPLTALKDDGGHPAVWVIEPGTDRVRLRRVETGSYREDGVGVRSGLSPGEIIVTAGVHKLLDGQSVRRLDAERAAQRSARTGG